MKFKLLYEIKGTRLIEVVTPEGTSLPQSWADMTLPQQDEWLYEHQSEQNVIYEDIDMSQVLTVREVL